jgi:peptidoglycan/xylan/chitin deacetylase (PgdA/CDA1 family)
MSSAELSALRAEFDRHLAEGRSFDFWWRDDDAVADGGALDRLIALTRSTNLPLSLAAIPARLERSLVDRVREEDGVTILVHGWQHANHAAFDERKAEFGRHRPVPEMMREARQALLAIHDAFGARALPVFVPPWNRVSPELARRLPELGYRAISAFGQAAGHGEIARIDTHLDPVEWRGSRGLAPAASLVAMIRRAAARGSDTIGLLTHHLVHDAALWRFCEELATLVADHPAICPVSAAAMLARMERLAAERVASVAGAAA